MFKRPPPGLDRVNVALAFFIIPRSGIFSLYLFCHKTLNFRSSANMYNITVKQLNK